MERRTDDSTYMRAREYRLMDLNLSIKEEGQRLKCHAFVKDDCQRDKKAHTFTHTLTHNP